MSNGFWRLSLAGSWRNGHDRQERDNISRPVLLRELLNPGGGGVWRKSASQHAMAMECHQRNHGNWPNMTAFWISKDNGEQKHGNKNDKIITKRALLTSIFESIEVAPALFGLLERQSRPLIWKSWEITKANRSTGFYFRYLSRFRFSPKESRISTVWFWESTFLSHIDHPLSNKNTSFSGRRAARVGSNAGAVLGQLLEEALDPTSAERFLRLVDERLQVGCPRTGRATLNTMGIGTVWVWIGCNYITL